MEILLNSNHNWFFRPIQQQFFNYIQNKHFNVGKRLTMSAKVCISQETSSDVGKRQQNV